MMEKIRIVKEILEDVLDKELLIHKDTKFSDLENWDSLSYITFYACLESELNVNLDLNRARKWETIGKLIEFLELGERKL